MPSLIEKIVDGFPFPTIDPNIGTPDYGSIADIHLKFNSNATSVKSNPGCSDNWVDSWKRESVHDFLNR